MAFLEIIHLAGDVERRDLSKTNPISIGSHRSNDVRIDEEGVELMHCRISWNKSHYEAVAAGTEPLDINGNSVQRASLSGDDVLRFGSVDIRFCDKEKQEKPAKDEASLRDEDLILKPITAEFEVAREKSKAAAAPPPPPKSPKPSSAKSVEKVREKQAEKPSSKKRAADLDDEEQNGDEGVPGGFGAALDALAQESISEFEIPKAAFETKAKPARDKKEKKEKKEKKSAGASPVADGRRPEPEVEAADEAEVDIADADEESASESVSDRLRQALHAQSRRPGEEDWLRHPLILALAGVSAVLVVTALIFYFIAGRQTTQAAFDEAKGQYDQGNFLTAVEVLGKFILEHPEGELAEEAKRLLGYARIRQQSEGADPPYGKGLEELRTFIGEQRDAEGFEEIHPNLAEMAKAISEGAATAAGKKFDPALLEVSKEARTLLVTYSPQDMQPTETLQKIEQSLRQSEAAILKDGVYREHVAKIEQHLTAKKPLQSLKARRDLLARYADFERDRKLVTLTNQMLDLEKSLVTAKDEDRTGLQDDHPVPPGSLSLVFQGRTRTDEVPVNKCVVARSKNCVYGLEFVTGAPIWRREIGLDESFFPIVDQNRSALFLFDSLHQEMQRIDQHAGTLVWRQPLGEQVRGKPLLSEGNLYVATQSGGLLSLDAESGNVVSQVSFSQPVTGPVELSDGARLLVAGDEEVIYTLSKRPLQCLSVTYLGHQAGSVEAPLLAMGSYALVIENKGPNAVLRLIETNVQDKPLTEVATANAQGRVLDEPAIRGRDLFVPSTVERVSSFTVSDDPGQPPLTAGPTFQGKTAEPGPIHLLTGPDQQLWMATGALTKLRRTTDSIQQEGEPSARGISAQPLQFVSGYLFNARKRVYTEAVTFTRTDRDQMTSDWQAVLGSRILAWTAAPSDPASLACVNESGQTFRVGTRQWEAGKFLSEAIYRLPLNEDLKDPLFASSLGDGRMAVACGGPEPRTWLVNAAGQIEGSPQLPTAPQAPPVRIGKLVAVPCGGRLHSLRFTGQPPVQDFMLATGEEQQWLKVLSVNDDAAVGITGEGVVYLIRLQTSPQPHLAEAGKVDLGQGVFVSPGAGDGLVAIADASQKLTVLDAGSLEARGQRTFEEAITNSVWVRGGKVFVEVGSASLHCLDPQQELPTLWQFDLGSQPVTGLSQSGDAVVIALQNGVVVAVNRGTGQEVRRIDLETMLAMGPEQIGPRMLVGTVDGTLIPIQDLLTKP